MVASAQFSFETYHKQNRLSSKFLLLLALVCMKEPTINFLCLLSSRSFTFNTPVFLTSFSLQPLLV